MNNVQRSEVQQKVALLGSDGVPVIAICERIIQTRVSYVRARTVSEALNEWQHGGEFDYDYLPDEHQVEAEVDIITRADMHKVDVYHYDDEMPISERDNKNIDLEFD